MGDYSHGFSRWKLPMLQLVGEQPMHKPRGDQLHFQTLLISQWCSVREAAPALYLRKGTLLYFVDDMSNFLHVSVSATCVSTNCRLTISQSNWKHFHRNTFEQVMRFWYSFPSLKQNLRQMHRSFKSVIKKTRIPLTVTRINTAMQATKRAVTTKLTRRLYYLPF